MGLNFFNFNLCFCNFGNFFQFPSFSCFPPMPFTPLSFPTFNCFPMMDFNPVPPGLFSYMDSSVPLYNSNIPRPMPLEVSLFNSDVSLFDGYFPQLANTGAPVYVPPAVEDQRDEEPKKTSKKSNSKASKPKSNVEERSKQGKSVKERPKVYEPSNVEAIDNSYTRLSRSEAEKKAKNDPNLEKLDGGQNWHVADTFITDIPYARKGTGKILQKVAQMIGEDLTITSALGTAGISGRKSPHMLGSYKSHHNAANPKLDIRATGSHIHELANKLRATGYFSHVLEERDHLDVQINPAKYRELSLLA